MKNTLKVIALLLAFVTVMSCLFGCGIEKPSLGSDELSTDGSDVLATGGDTENSATEKNKNTASSKNFRK